MVATPYVAVGATGAAEVLLADTTLVVLLLVAAGVAGIRSTTARWIAAGLAVLAAVWIVVVETVVLPWGSAATIAIAVVRALLVLLGAALNALSTRWLGRAQGVAPPVVQPPMQPAQSQLVAPPVVHERDVAPPTAAPVAPAAPAPRTEHAPGVPADVDAAIDQSDQEMPTEAPGPRLGGERHDGPDQAPR